MKTYIAVYGPVILFTLLLLFVDRCRPDQTPKGKAVKYSSDTVEAVEETLRAKHSE